MTILVQCKAFCSESIMKHVSTAKWRTQNKGAFSTGNDSVDSWLIVNPLFSRFVDKSHLNQ